MDKFENFKKAFEEKYFNKYCGTSCALYTLLSANETPFGGKLVEETSTIIGSYSSYDSYSESSETWNLIKVYYFADFDVYIQFEGEEDSYSGTDWYGYKEVKPYEETKIEYR